MYKSITVPLDGTAFGERALPTAVRFALANGAALNMLHVHTPPQPEAYPESFTPFASQNVPDSARHTDHEVWHQEEDYLARVARPIRARIRVTTTSLTRDTSLEHGLHEAIRSLGTDMVTMATHRRSLLQKLLNGSAGEAVVRNLHLPTMLLPARDDDAGTVVRGTHKTVIALDGSSFAEEILEPAVEAARVMQSEITLLAIADPTVATPVAASVRPPLDVDDPDAIPLDVYLATLQRQLQISGIRTTFDLVRSRNVADAILRYAKETAAGLVAMTTHGRSGAARVLMGSVAEHVVRHSEQPVLLLRPVLSPAKV